MSELALTSCEAALAVRAWVRHSFIGQWHQLTEGKGLMQPVQVRGTDEFANDGTNVSQISAARVQEIVNTCAQRIGQPAGAPATENIGG